MAEASTSTLPGRAAPTDWRETVRRWPLPAVGVAALAGLAAGRALGPGGTTRGPDGSFLRPQEAAVLGRALIALVGQGRSWLGDLERRMKEGR